MSDVFSFISALVFVAAVLPYVADIVMGPAVPRRATWLVWAVGDWIIVTGMSVKDTYNSLLWAACLGATTIFLLSLFKGEKGLNRRDKTCLTLSGIAILLWQYFGDSNWGIAFSAISLAIAAWPTYVSVWEKPENESASGWILFNLSSLLGLGAIRAATFADVVPPVIFVAIDLPMLYLLFLRPYLRYRKHQFI